jgi:hypothetical protein
MQNGLERRGYKEVGFLREVDEVVRTGDAFRTLLFIQSREKLTSQVWLELHLVQITILDLICCRCDTCREASEPVRDEVEPKRGPCFRGIVILIIRSIKAYHI